MKFAVELSRSAEARSIENPTVPVSSDAFFAFFGVDTGKVPAVTIDSALKVPAVSAAATFLPRTLAALPLHAHRLVDGKPQRIEGGLQTLVHDAPNPEWTSFGWRQYFWQGVFTVGRGLSWIEKSGTNIVAIWPFDPAATQVKRRDGRKVYTYERKEYPASEVIDVPFMLKANQLDVRGPIVQGAKAISLALAMNDYASGFFAGGGVPPLAMTGPLAAGGDALKRQMADVHRAIQAAKESDKPIFPMPGGYDLKPVGFDPDKGQMTEARRFQIEEIARIYNLPPVFLQDLTRGTFSNTEQQDLHLVKHLVAQWAKALEQEMNLKLFGQMNTKRYVEHNLDGLLRGDFKSRIEGIVRGVQAAVYQPEEARKFMGLPDSGDPAAGKLYMQGATVPLGSQPTANSNGDGNEPGTSGADDAA